MSDDHDHPTAYDFRFEDDRHAATIVCTHVWTDGQPILMVSHDADGDWQFLCGEGSHGDSSEGMIVCLGHVVSRDPSLNELASMCTGHRATRASPGAEWRIEDETLDDIEQTIAEYGWWVGLLPGEDGRPAFAYTIGLIERFEHPELIIFGLGLKTMHEILNQCGDQIRKGARFAAGQSAREILEGNEVRFRTVSNEACGVPRLRLSLLRRPQSLGAPTSLARQGGKVPGRAQRGIVPGDGATTARMTA